MRTLALVCLAGAIGTGLRHLINNSFLESEARSLHYGTLIINIIGSFLMGLLLPVAAKRGWSVPVVAMIATGFLGGFTTYSRFNYDMTIYFTTGEWMKAFAYMTATVIGCLCAGFLGLAVAAHQ